MVESTSESNHSYILRTAKNYQSRHQRFSLWAEEDRNANAAKKCRELFLHFLSLRLSKYLQDNHSNMELLNEINLLDAGCGSGRDLKEFSRSDLAIPVEQTSCDCNNIFKNSRTCFNKPCYICDKLDAKDNVRSQNIQNVKTRATGFDVCHGFVEKCQEMGLNAVLEDFLSFFETLEQKEKSTSGLGRLYDQFHGIFALASLFHLPRLELQKVLKVFERHLHPEVGVLLTSIPSGNKDEVGSDGRWKLHISASEQINMLEQAGFKVIFQENLTIYNGSDWIVLISIPKQ